MQIKKIPMRTCIACRENKSKKEMLRIVKNKEGEISLDLTGKKAGRGAYICPELACFKKLQKGKLLNKAFSCNVSEDVYKQIEEDFVGK